MLDDLSKEVLNKIKHDDIKMKSRAHFVLRTILFFAGIVFAFAVGLFLVSFIFFVYHANALGELHHFGASGIAVLLRSLPWILMLAALIIVVVLELLSTHFAFVYKRPLVYTLLALVIILVFGGLAIGHTHMHDRAFELAQQRRLSLAGPLYQKFGSIDFRNVYFGEVIDVIESLPTQVIIKTGTGDLLTVAIRSGLPTKMPENYFPKKGDRIMVIGYKYQGEDMIVAEGIRPLSDTLLRKRPLFDRRFPMKGQTPGNEIN